MSSEVVINASNIRKLYDGSYALDGIDLEVRQGQITGLIGPNGAGKSSLMNLITGVIKPNYGNIIINNEDITQYPIYVRTKKFKISIALILTTY